MSDAKATAMDVKSDAVVDTHSSSDAADISPGTVEAGVSRDDRGWSRSLTPRQVIMLSLGGGIGTGLWVGTGTALAMGGPGACVVGYGLVALAIYIEFMSIGEMTCYKPVHGGYIRQCMEYVDKSAAFAMGMNFWFSWVMIIPAEIIACISVLQYWEAARDFPIAAYITIFLVGSALPNVFAVRIYGHAEVVGSLIKVTAIIMCMCFMFIMASGGVPATGGPLVFTYWKNPGAFRNGVKGISRALVQAAFSCTSAGWLALTAGEMQQPRRTVKRSIGPLFWRMFLFYVVNIWLVGMCVPYDDPDLNNAEGTLASPFIIAVKRGGQPALAHLLNALVFLTVLSCGVTSFYVASRALTSMSDLGIIHGAFGQKDTKGRPVVALVVSGVLGGGLTYLNCNDTAVKVYGWFSSLVGVSSFMNWGLIYLSHIRFRKGLKAQGIDYHSLPFYNRASPWGQYFGLFLIFVFLAAELYFALFPFGGSPTAEGFFSTYLSVPLFILDYVGYKLWFRTKVVKPKEMDFTPAFYFDEEDRREKEAEEANPSPKLPWYTRAWRVMIG
ncbi:putative amino acid permease protein [Neofusicoccum parvum]|uniref:Amino acid permease protein n=1 Tax=Neofusicoccum parvum TaxID=310453 RepID=A0ACB5SDT5_9PEZI|nr:putative amino acid permease protein [Neofusicoccum parvum]